ncbi:MAG: peptide-methionine (S)-S-oxide reductase MsrA [Chthoniobacterales bacterium]|nr:peptide-methionine (S)-S-oxide reductase MsrA [Chthoniobacterales bacterium]
MHKILSTIFLVLACCAATLTAQAETKTAIFAGGCFWCMQAPFDAAKGVTQTIVGYTGGSKETANYELVSAHKTQHREAIEVTYDPAKISYDQLLEIFWHNINPTQADGQFHDLGLSYQAAIYFADDAEKKQAETSKERLDKSGKFKQAVVTEILPRMPFYPAEDYHQKYYLKNPQDFESYHIGSGRVDYLEGIWGKPDR